MARSGCHSLISQTGRMGLSRYVQMRWWKSLCAQVSVEERNVSHVTTCATTQLDFEDLLSKLRFLIT